MSDDDSDRGHNSDTPSRFDIYLTEDNQDGTEQERGADNSDLVNTSLNAKKGSNENIGRENERASPEQFRWDKYFKSRDESEQPERDIDSLVQENTEDEQSADAASPHSEAPAGMHVPSELQKASHVLVLNQSGTADTNAVCRELIHQQKNKKNILLVNVTGDMAERMKICLEDRENQTNKVGVINVGTAESTRPAASMITGDTTESSITIRNISNPANLSRFGISTAQLVSTWREETQHPTSLCFHSLSPLLNSRSPQSVFQFLFTLQQTLGTDGVTSHYHLDPGAHAEEVTRTFRDLFDGVIRVSSTDEIEIVSAH